MRLAFVGPRAQYGPAHSTSLRMIVQPTINLVHFERQVKAFQQAQPLRHVVFDPLLLILLDQRKTTSACAVLLN